MFDALFSNSNSLLSVLGSAALLFGSYLSKKYIIPYLNVGKRKQYAQYIALIADEVTDNLRKKYPDNIWLKHIEEGVDILVSICGISPEIARRAINAAAARK